MMFLIGIILLIIASISLHSDTQNFAYIITGLTSLVLGFSLVLISLLILAFRMGLFHDIALFIKYLVAVLP